MIVCEIGLNHLGDTAYADQYLHALLVSRPDAITFQVAEPGFYKHETEKWRLPDNYYQTAFQKIRGEGIKTGMALADENKVPLFEELGADFYKVLSKDFHNTSLLQRLFSTGKKVFVSTGLVGLEEIKTFLGAWSNYRRAVTLIHTQFSPALADVELKAITALRQTTGCPVAFGSHCQNPNVLFTALAFEPSDMFFYVKGGMTTKHPDENHAVSLTETATFINNLRELPLTLGSGEKKLLTHSFGKQSSH